MNTRVLFYLGKRVLYYVATLLVSFSVVFWVLRVIPGDPVTRYYEHLSEVTMERGRYAQEIVQRYREMFGLDQGIFKQYMRYLYNAVIRFDLGPSFLNFPVPAQELIAVRLPWSIGLLSVSILISWVLGIIAGTLVGWRRGTKFDTTLLSFSLFMSTLPRYLLAILLVLVFGYGLTFFPTGGAYAASLSKGFNLPFILSVIKHAILPGMSFVLVSTFAWLITSRAVSYTHLRAHET